MYIYIYIYLPEMMMMIAPNSHADRKREELSGGRSKKWRPKRIKGIRSRLWDARASINDVSI